jgi:4'-phosphopantetheinyl transferase EntD
MNSVHCSKLFNSSTFFIIKKSDILSLELENLKKKIFIPDTVHSYHPEKLKDYQLGRLCAAKAFQMYSNDTISCLDLPSNSDRSPKWPDGIVGSISHSKDYVAAVVSNASDLAGIGIDLEIMGRAKLELTAHLKTSKDLIFHPDFSDKELLTLIFSAKESLYKALYPIVKQFFGFEAAAITHINFSQSTFTCELLKDLSAEFGPHSRSVFEGRFYLEDNHCLTAIEVIPSL